MKKILTIGLLALLLWSCHTAQKTQQENAKLNGTWIPVKEEMAGNTLPPAAYQEQKLIINDTTYIMTAESIDKGAVQAKDGKMDIYGRGGVNKGKHFTAIYKFENDQLVVCYNLTGTNYPESFDTKGKPMYFLAVYRKE